MYNIFFNKTSMLILTIILMSISAYAQLTQHVTYATYIGGSRNDFALNIELDGNDDIFLSIITQGGCVTTPGVHQQQFGGSYDALLQKRDKKGNLIWSTYYGGSRDDYVQKMKLLKSGKIALVGFTESGSGIAKNGHQNTYGGGGEDCFIAVFNPDGTLDWATYFGGSNDDNASSITEDSEGNIYVCGDTKSTTKISTEGAYQPQLSGGYDGFLVKFSADGQLIWSTYLGGTGYEYLYDLQVDSEDNLWLGGETSSTSGITTLQAHKVSNSGAGDGFLMSFDKDGKRLYGTYYGGSRRDEIFVIRIDQDDNIWFGGRSQSISNIASTNAIKPYISGVNDVFLAKFNKSKRLQWATYLGGSDLDFLREMTLDKQGNAVLIMSTTSEDFIPIDIDYAMQPDFGGLWDAVYTKIDPNGKLIWSTYHGGKGEDGNGDVKINTQNELVILTNVGSQGLHTDDAEDTTLDGESDALVVILKEVDISKTTESSKETFIFNIIPNPVADKFTIDIPDFDKYKVDIFDYTGKAIHDYIREANGINTRMMTSGVFYIWLTDSTTGVVAGNSFVKI